MPTDGIPEPSRDQRDMAPFPCQSNHTSPSVGFKVPWLQVLHWVHGIVHLGLFVFRDRSSFGWFYGESSRQAIFRGPPKGPTQVLAFGFPLIKVLKDPVTDTCSACVPPPKSKRFSAIAIGFPSKAGGTTVYLLCFLGWYLESP